MSLADQLTGVVHFGVFEADLRSGELRKRGMRVRLPGQSFQVLEALLSRPGELVSRDELRHRLWPMDSFGDFEHGLNAAVNRVREALGDSADNPRFVETLPRRGYRFIAAVDARAVNGHAAAESAAAESAVAGEKRVGWASTGGAAAGNVGARPVAIRKFPVVAALLVVVLLFAGAMLYRRFAGELGKGGQDQTQEDLKVVPLTTLPGLEFAPTFSPDGSQVAFAWNGGQVHGHAPLDLYVKVVGSEHLERLTRKPSNFLLPAWSPDGRNIAFVRYAERDGGIFVIDARGGPERKLADELPPAMYPSSVSWSADSRRLIYSAGGILHALTLETGANAEVRAACKEAYSPVFSPDGTTIAFVCYTDDDGSEIYSMPQGGGTAKLLSKLSMSTDSIVWSEDGERILLVGDGDLWEIGKAGGKLRHMVFARGGWEPAVSRTGRRLAFVTGLSKVEMVGVSMDGDEKSVPTVVAPSTKEQRNPDISPDGKKIVFESERSGWHEVWVANRDGSDAMQLSNFHRLTGTAKWSPDGKQIVFDSRESGAAALYLVDPERGVPQRIPITGLPQSVPSWSKDGKWIYFRAGRAKTGALYKVTVAGGDPVLVSETRGYNVQESGDGRSLYFLSKQLDGEIYKRDRITGEERPVAGMPHVGSPGEWVLTATGIYFFDRSVGPASIAFFDFATAKVSTRIKNEKDVYCPGGLALSPDGKAAFYAVAEEPATDLMMVDGFR